VIEQYNSDEKETKKEVVESEMNQPPPAENRKIGEYYTFGAVPPLSYGVSEEVPAFLVQLLWLTARS